MKQVDDHNLVQAPEENRVRERSNSHTRRIRVLTFVQAYLPGYKAGGPVRSISNMVEALGREVEFFLVTTDRDIGDRVPYASILPGRWNEVGNAKVFYCSTVSLGKIFSLAREVNPDIVLLNSYHDRFTRLYLTLRRFKLVRNAPVLLAPRGEFSLGALKIKAKRKLLYRRLAELLGLYRNITWQASSSVEVDQIVHARPSRDIDPKTFALAPEFTSPAMYHGSTVQKQPGEVKLAFIARICRMKNLEFLLDALAQIRGQVQLDLYGPISKPDETYWNSCQTLMERLIAGVTVKYCGSIDNAEVPKVLSEHHFFVLPTHGENFCHSAVEALNNGIPVLLSDATPWRNLAEAQAGFDIPLSDRKAWTAALQTCVSMDADQYQRLKDGVQRYRTRFSSEHSLASALATFNRLVASRKCSR